MTTLEDFARAVIEPALPPPAGVTSRAGTNDPARFAVYRNNIHVSLVEALAKGFPVTRMLVGESFFFAMARLFVADEKPGSPVLIHYGAGFPAFVSGFEPARAVPYLADVARLELAWRGAYHAADEPSLALQDLGAIAPQTLARATFTRHPAATLVSSRHPIGSIWAAHQVSPPTRPDAAGAQTVLITRPAAEVQVTILPRSDVEFTQAMLWGDTVGEAADIALGTQDFDPGRALVGLVGLGVFTQFSLGENL